MKGKKTDSEFVSDFISSCSMLGRHSIDDISRKAIAEIEEIDKKIIEAEKLKVRRSKLKDVLISLQTTNEKDDSKNILFFGSLNKKYYESIVPKCKTVPFLFESENYQGEEKENVYRFLNRLVRIGVLKKVNEYFVPSKFFNDYVEFCDSEFKR